ncbi:MAG: flagellar hook-basal body complex protein FliE [Gammaproteobacteria bacterium]|nr:flagellar hook-basal body complex protein FliE [Gammaproteobacteria bacterium]
MNTINTNALLLQLRAMAQDAGVPESEGSKPIQDVEFSEVMKSTLEKVNERSNEATKLMQSFDAGDPNVELADVMIAMQKARVSFEALTQVRNKMVSAYQDIMNMPL